MKLFREKVTLDKERVTALEEAAFQVCGLLRLTANTEPGTRDYVLGETSPVWELLIAAEIKLHDAVVELRPLSAAGVRLMEGRDGV